MSKSIPSFKHTSSCTITKTKPSERTSPQRSWHRAAAAHALGTYGTRVRCASSPLSLCKEKRGPNVPRTVPSPNTHTKVQNSCLKGKSLKLRPVLRQKHTSFVSIHAGRKASVYTWTVLGGIFCCRACSFLRQTAVTLGFLARGASSFCPHFYWPHIRALREGLGLLISSRTVYMPRQAALFSSQLLVDSDYIPF